MGYKVKRWPSKAKGDRDKAADNAAEAYVTLGRLRRRIASGETTRTGQIIELQRAEAALLRALMALQAAGAEVDVT